MKNAVGDAQEALGGVLAPVVQSMAGFFESAAEKASDFFLSITETDLDSVIRRLKEAGVSGEALSGLEMINLKNQLNDINEVLDDQSVKYKTVADAEQALTHIGGEVKTVGEGINEGIEKRELLLGRLRGLQKAQEEGILNESGNYEVLNEITGVTKEIAEANLNTMIATTQASLGYSTSLQGINEELDGTTLKTEQITNIAERQLDSAVMQSEHISDDIELLVQKEALEKKILDLNTKIEKSKAGQTKKTKAQIDAEKKLEKETQNKIELKKIEGKFEDALKGKITDKLGLVKEGNIKSATADAYKMAEKAYLAFAEIPIIGPALGAVAAAGAFAFGMKNVAGIKKAQYGADFVTDGPQMMMVGEGSGPERVQVTPLSDPNIDGPQGQPITLNISGNVLHESFVEDNVIPQIREGLRIGENIGL